MKMAEPNDYILECTGLSKAFGGSKALKEVELHIRRGEVHAIVGENGAGKSTLMKIIIGLLKADSGEIRFEGKPYKVNSPAEAINHGITMIHQELNPEPYLTVAENIFLNNEDVKGIILDKKTTNEKARALLKEFDFKVSPTHMVEDLTLAQAQVIEIIKAVTRNAKLVIMDEPTSSLDSEETEQLFRIIRKLKADGVSVVYISHRMEEIFGICDTVSVFRDGRYIGTRDINDVSTNDLITMMVGHEVSNIFPKVDCEIGDVVFKVENLCGKGFDNISFEVHAGEILGFTGLAGAGRSETMRAIFGLDKLTSGRMYLNGKEIKVKSPRGAIEQGIVMVNEDRRAYGLCLYRSISENISLPNLPDHQKGIFLNKRKEKRENSEYARMLTVKAASLNADAISLSGGNQQKVVLAKWIMANPKVMILDEPTRGVDVGAKAEIYEIMNDLTKQGVSIIMISSELPEIINMADRVYVMCDGRVTGCIDYENVSQEAIMHLATVETAAKA